MKVMALMALAPEIHTANISAGWWPQDAWGSPAWAGTIRRKTNLIHSEAAEITEAHRRNLRDDHLPLYPGIVAEAADVAIRSLDMFGHFDKTLGGALTAAADWQDAVKLLEDGIVGKFYGDFAVEEIVAAMHFSTVEIVSNLMKADVVSAAMSCILLVVQAGELARIAGFDLATVVEDKRAYNAERADHTVVARAAPNGKKY